MSWSFSTTKVKQQEKPNKIEWKIVDFHWAFFFPFARSRENKRTCLCAWKQRCFIGFWTELWGARTALGWSQRSPTDWKIPFCCLLHFAFWWILPPWRNGHTISDVQLTLSLTFSTLSLCLCSRQILGKATIYPSLTLQQMKILHLTRFSKQISIWVSNAVGMNFQVPLTVVINTPIINQSSVSNTSTRHIPINTAPSQYSNTPTDQYITKA